jgi:GT2 family glycosyltransferase
MTDTVIIILTFNQLEKTRRCLAALAEGEITEPVLLWDNGSEDSTAESIRAEFPYVRVHEHPANLGVASGRNAAAALARELYDPRFLLFLDNDILVEAGFVQALKRVFDDNSRLGQAQAKLRLMDDRMRLNDGGGARVNFLLWQISPVGYGELDAGQYDIVKPCICCGGAMMVRAEVFRELGGFDTLFDPFGPEDLDFSLRLQKAGYGALYVPQAVAYHKVSHTFGEGYSEEYARHKSRHWFHFMRRHASPLQQLGFFLLGAPYLAVRVAVREGSKGNLGAVRGLFRGILDLVVHPGRDERAGGR